MNEEVVNKIKKDLKIEGKKRFDKTIIEIVNSIGYLSLLSLTGLSIFILLFLTTKEIFKSYIVSVVLSTLIFGIYTTKKL